VRKQLLALQLYVIDFNCHNYRCVLREEMQRINSPSGSVAGNKRSANMNHHHHFLRRRHLPVSCFQMLYSKYVRLHLGQQQFFKSECKELTSVRFLTSTSQLMPWFGFATVGLSVRNHAGRRLLQPRKQYG